MSSILIRSYQSIDEEAVRKICGDTALYGQKIELLISDRKFVVDVLLMYYTKFEPESLFVAEHEGKVVGYLAGCVDTKRFEHTFLYQILPSLIKQFLTQGHWHLLLSWRVFVAFSQAGQERQQILNRIIDTYPAHCHVNLSQHFQQKGIGSTLFSHFLLYLEEQDIRGIHVSTATEAGKAFFLNKGFKVVGKHLIPRLPVDTPKENWLMAREL